MKPWALLLTVITFSTAARTQKIKSWHLEVVARLLLYTVILCAQGPLSFAQSNSLLIKYSPLSLLDINTPSIQIGVEYKFSNWGIQADYGFSSPTLIGNRNNEIIDHTYYKLRSEIRYYPSRLRNKYFATEYFYVPRSYTRFNDYYYSQNGITYDYESSQINYNVWGLCGKFGLLLKIHAKWFLDAYGGIGFRNVSVHHTPTNTTIPQVNYFEEWSVPRDKFEGINIYPHLSLGFKITYRIDLKGKSNSI